MQHSAHPAAAARRAATVASLLVAGLAAPDAAAELLDPRDFASLGTLELTTGSYVIDTDAVTIAEVGGGVLFTGVADDQKGQASPGVVPEIAVFAFDSFNLGPGATVSVVGDRALGLLSHGDGTLATPLSVNGQPGPLVFAPDIGGGIGGPGGFDGGGAIAGVAQDGEGPGGGGARNVDGSTSLRVTGGPGSFGSSLFPSADGLFAPPGEVYGDLTQTLQGGSGGGAVRSDGGFFPADPGTTPGGGGGGAIEIGTLGLLQIAADISADGADQPAPDVTRNGGPGSGGGIRVHAERLDLLGDLTADGGINDLEVSQGGGGRVLVQSQSGPTYTLGQTAPITTDWLDRISVLPGLADGADPALVTKSQRGVITLGPSLIIVPDGQTIVLGQAIDASTDLQTIGLLASNTRITRGGTGTVAAGGYVNRFDIELDDPTAAIAGAGTFTNNGSLAGTGVVATPVVNTDRGRIDAVGDTLAFTSPVTNEAGGRINAIESSVDFGGGLDNQPGGRVNLIDTIVAGDAVNNGTVAGVGEVVFTGDVSGSGEFLGIDATTLFAAGLAPGNSIGGLAIAGDAVLLDTATLRIELAAEGFDTLTVGGTLTLDAALDVTLLDDFSPRAGDTFTFLTAGSTLGGFAGLPDGHVVARHDGLDLVIRYGAGDGNDIALVTVPEPVAVALLALGAPLLATRRQVVGRR